MWLIDNSLKISETMAIYDPINKKVVTYYYIHDGKEPDEEDIEWYQPYKNELFCETEVEAISIQNAKVRELRAKMKEVKEFLEYMDDVYSNDNFHFEESDFLPKKYTDDFWEGQYKEYKFKYCAVRQVARTGMLNINAESFKVGDVVRIKWNTKKNIDGGTVRDKETATLVLKDGKEVETYSRNEYDLVKDIYGENNSGRTFTLNEAPRNPYRPNMV